MHAFLCCSDRGSASPSAEAGSDAEEGGAQRQQDHQLQGGGRARFTVPHRQQQQQQPRTPLDLGLKSSPTIDELLEGGDVGAGAGLEALPGSPVEQARPSQRLWLPQRAAPQLQQEEEGRGPQLALVSPAGPAFLQQQQQQQQQAGEGGVTPGAPLAGMQAIGSASQPATQTLCCIYSLPEPPNLQSLPASKLPAKIPTRLMHRLLPLVQGSTWAEAARQAAAHGS